MGLKYAKNALAAGAPPGPRWKLTTLIQTPNPLPNPHGCLLIILF